MKTRIHRSSIALAVVAAAVLIGVAWGETEPPGPLDRGDTKPPVALQQCGECHIVFPSRMLPSRSWAAILSRMDDHFGEDAAIPEKDLDEIRSFLTSHAADSPDATPRERHYMSELLPDSAPLRITATPWWNQVHADFDFDGVKRSSVKSPANCLACHNNRVVR